MFIQINSKKILNFDYLISNIRRFTDMKLFISKSKFKLFFMLASLTTFMAMMLATSASRAEAQEDPPKEYVKVLFWVEDALGNRDSCWFIGTPTATDLIDEHLGEVNLFGVEPTSPLDIRIIQRTDDNHNGYWLYKLPSSSNDWANLQSSEQNIDLKIDYRWYSHWDSTKLDGFPIQYVVLNVNANNYPVTVYTSTEDVFYMDDWSSYLLYEKDGLFIEQKEMDVYNPVGFHSINSADENFLIRTYLDSHYGIAVHLSKLSVFPNPSSDFVFIDGIENEEIQVIDVNGKFICSFGDTENLYKLDVSNFSNGVYFLVSNNQLLNKFIKKGGQ